MASISSRNVLNRSRSASTSWRARGIGLIDWLLATQLATEVEAAMQRTSDPGTSELQQRTLPALCLVRQRQTSFRPLVSSEGWLPGIRRG